MRKSIVLVETRNGCAIMEPQPRYDVLLRGNKVGQLYFNMRGYVGNLPTPRGTQLDIGERGIGAFRKAVAQLNKEWAEVELAAKPLMSQFRYGTQLKSETAR